MGAIDSYSYLWNGTESGWVLLYLNRKILSLSIVFPQEAPSVHDVKVLREIVPSFQNIPVAEVLSSVRGKSVVSIGEFESKDGHLLAEACRKHGLTVQTTVLDKSGYLPFNEETKFALVIEDEALAHQVKEKALRNGLPVRHVEA